MAKSRVKTKLKQKVSKKKSHNTSEDLAKLTEDYNAFCTKLQGLVKVCVESDGEVILIVDCRSNICPP